ncbi:MAG: hypothetical protein H7202_03275 [Pedobacter sp.]|nr:hypothetical protein [Pedobacter sp.]
MKKITLLLFLSLIGIIANAQTTPNPPAILAGKAPVPKEIKNQTVEIACGECKFKIEGKSCDLAIRIDGKSYFVDGKSIDDFGDAHDEKHGFCNVIKKAEVTGEIVNNRFKAKTITLLPEKK